MAVLEEELQQLKVELELVKSSQTEDPQVNGYVHFYWDTMWPGVG